MNQFIPLNETGLHALIVPIDGDSFKISKIFPCTLSYKDYDPGFKFFDLPPGKWEIIGCVTEKEIDFDPHGFVEDIDLGDVEDAQIMYKNYADGNFNFWWPEESFRSLLTSKEIFWVNPMGIVPRRQVYSSSPQEQEYFDDTTNKDGIEEWRRLQSKCLTENQKVLIINKVA